MPTTVAQSLAARGLAPADVAAAELRAKVQGGGIETAVLELGLSTEAQMIELVTEGSRLPRPPVELLAQLGPAVAPLFPQQLAERHGMVPLGLQRRQLQLLVRHPVDLAQVDEISFLLSRPIKLFVGIELEVVEAIKEVYGVAIPDRFLDLRKKIGKAATAEPAAPPPSLPKRATQIVLGSAGATGRTVSGAGILPAAPVATPSPVAVAPEAVTPRRESTAVDAAARAPTLTGFETPTPVALSEGEAAARAPTLTGFEAPAPVALSEAEAAARAPTSPGLTLVPRPVDVAPAPTAPAVELSAPVVSAAPALIAVAAPPLAAVPSEPAAISLPPVPTAPAAILAPPVPSESAATPAPPAPREPEAPPAPAESAVPKPAVAPSPVSAVGAADQSADPMSKAFWDEAGDLLGLKTRTPVLPEVAPPLPVREPTPEPSPFEAPPVEAEPLTSGFAGRASPDRRLSPAETMNLLRAQPTRDGVVGTAVSYLRGAFDFVAMFTRHGDSFQVFEASGVDYGGGADLSQTVVDLEHSRVLRTVVEGRAPYVGPVPAGDPLESALGAIGRARLRAVLLYPIVIRDRTVAIVHGDRGGEALAPRQLSDVALVLSQLGGQLERVIREKRQSALKRKEASAPAPVAAPLPQRPPPLPPRPVAPIEAAVPVVPVASDPIAVVPAAAEVAVAPAVPPSPVVSPAREDDSALDAAMLGDAEPFEVPIDWVDIDEGSSFADQVRAFLSGDPPARAKAAAVLRSGGAEAAKALAERFPGPLFVFRTTIDELPGPDGIGPVLGVMAAIGNEAIPALVQLADAPGEERRFWATVLLARFGDKRAIEVLARRLRDSSPDIALAARRGLFRLRKEPEFAAVLDQVTNELTSTSNPERLTAVIRALGQFHHVPAIPRLIALVGIRDPQISSAAADALRELTRQDFGTAERRWANWWTEAKDRPRLKWLIEALESRDRDLRLAAISELTEIAGLDFGYRSDIEPRKQEGPVGRWQEWWEREGKTRSAAP